jgi:hypothetical protein
MNITKTADIFKDYLYLLFRRIISEPEPVHICQKTIQRARPYISFVFLDTDSVPLATNFPLRPSYSFTLFHPVILRQHETKLYEGSLYSNAQREKPLIQSFTLDYQTGLIDSSIHAAAKRVSLEAAFDSTAQCENPVILSFKLDAQTSIIDNSTPLVERPVSIVSTLDPAALCENPVIRSFKLDTQTSIIDNSTPLVEQPVSIVSMLDPAAQHEKPAFFSMKLDTQTGVIDKSFPSAEQRVFLVSTLDPVALRENPVIRSFKLDAQTSVIDDSIPLVEQRVSFTASRDFTQQNQEVLTHSYILENQFGPCIHNIMTEEHKCDSCNLSLLVTEPSCYDHNMFGHETRCRIVRYHRYSGISHGDYFKTKHATEVDAQDAGALEMDSGHHKNA